MAPRFITLEGGEGAGKSTQVKLLAKSFAAAGIKATTTREPGGSKGAEAIRGLVVSGDLDWKPETEALLFMTARYDHVEMLIKPAIEKGEWVICDRYYDSTYVYQGIAKGVNTNWLDVLYEKLFGSFKPDCTLLLDLPAEEGLKRASARGNDAESRFEKLGVEFHSKLRAAFLDRAKKEEARFAWIDALQSPDKVHADIIAVLNKRFALALKPASL